MATNKDAELPEGWKKVKNINGTVLYLDPHDIVHERLPLPPHVELAQLRQEVEQLKEQLRGNHTIAESGVIQITANGDVIVKFSEKYTTPPLVALTPFGTAQHATATLCEPPTTIGFKARLITHVGGWETGKIYWFAVRVPTF